MQKKLPTVELCKGKVRWFYRLKSSNGNILSTSQKYFSKSNAKRAAQAASWTLGANYKEV
jgi:uncharacterized protein YegP (UPF0339 family)